jgi:3-dehydroquinate synthase
MPVIRVQLEQQGYEVLISSGAITRAAEQSLAALARTPTMLLLVTSPRVRKYCAKPLLAELKRTGVRYKLIEMPDGERHKNLNTIAQLMRDFAKAGADRGSAVLALGGGVVGDVAAFAASIYMRGIPVVQLPTTLLAQVDAAVGGKTGVNLAEGKNLVGTFHQPKLVLCDPDVLRTLSEREFRAGLFEVIKCGIIRDPALLAFMEQNRGPILRRNANVLERIIAASVQVKADVVAADEREGDLRRILNFGHTIGHALEAESDYKRFLHGEAVGWGMIAAAEIARATGTAPDDLFARVRSVVELYGPLPPVTASPKRILRLVQSDKKTVGGVCHFVLPTAAGEVVIKNDVSPEVVLQAVKRLREISHVRSER